MTIKNFSYFLISAIGIVVILIYGQDLMIPFVFALLLWFIIRQSKLMLDKISLVRKYIPNWLKTVMVSVLIFGLLGVVSNVLSKNINQIAKSYGKYEANVDKVLDQINTQFDIDLVDYLKVHSTDFDFGSILGAVLNSVTDLLGSAFMIVLYAIFVFLEEANFVAKLRLMFSDKDQYEKFVEILDRIERSISKYLGLKTFVSFITGLLSFVILAFIGVDSPVFWSFLIFVLNFIPNIGSLSATIFPTFYCLLQFGGYEEALLVLVLVGTVQTLVGNLIEPKLLGNSMNISSLVTILSLSFWGAIWGITGMILSVPITMIMILVLSHFPKTKPLAILLSEKGELK